ncbi:MAG: glycosyltransferase family 39 protein [Candidatus Micrarchaeota archaeon]
MKKWHLALLFLLCYLMPRLFVGTTLGLLSDEGLYVIMMEEQMTHATLIPTFFGYEMGWKPPLYFWLSIPFVAAAKATPLPIELVYRLSNLIFGLLAAIPLYLIYRKFQSEEFSYLGLLAYALLPLVIYPESRALTDTLCFLFLLTAVWAYLEYKKGQIYFLLAAVAVFLAFFTKQTLAFLPPIVFAAYLWQNDKKTLKSKEFLLSLLALPVAFIINYLAYSSPAEANLVFSEIITGKLLGGLTYDIIFTTLAPLLYLSGPFLVLAALGVIRNWKNNAFFSVWLLLIIFPLLAGKNMPWYFLPIAPAIIYFSLLAIFKDGEKLRIDAFAMFMFGIFLITSWVFFFPIYQMNNNAALPAKAVGEFLAFKENVLIAGKYSSGVFAYKELEERRVLGRPLDYGLIIIQEPDNTSLQKLIDNYHYKNASIVDGNFLTMFYDNRTYRKDTNLTKFSYVAITGELNVTAGEKIENVTDVNWLAIYKR